MSNSKVAAETVARATAPLVIQADGDEPMAAGTPLLGRGPISIARINPDDKVRINRAAVIPVRLLKVQVPGSFEPEYYYFAPGVRDEIGHRLKLFMIIPYWSTLKKRPYLAVYSTGTESGWSDAIHVLLAQPAEWYDANDVQIAANKAKSKYDIEHWPTAIEPQWPAEKTEELMGEALGPNRVIESANHPAYLRLVNSRGEVLI